MTNILLRVDAGSYFGLGHLQRCLSLAIALRQANARCIFLTPDERAVQDRVARLGFAIRALEDVEPGDDEDYRQTLSVAERRRCDAVVVDSYHVDGSYLEQLRAAGFLVVAIDDLARFPFPCHVVVSSGAQAETLPYRSSTGDTRFLLGPKYALLREEFWDIPSRRVEDEVRNVLVTMGGADGHNLTPVILEMLDSLPSNFNVTAVVGPFFNRRAEVEAAAKHCQRFVRLVHSPNSVRDLMLEADLAISAGGQTLYELAATGTPTIAIQVVENQTGNIRSFAQHGIVSPIILEDREWLRVALADEVTHLLMDSKQRKQMSQAGRMLVDGKGAIRCATRLLELSGRSYSN